MCVILNAYNPYSTTSLLSFFCPRPTVYNIFQQVCNCSSHLKRGKSATSLSLYHNSMQGDDISVCSLNVRGLSNNKKRRETFLWLKKKKKFSIYFLQEVHSTRETEICWQSERGYSTIFTNFSSSRAGVGILFNNNFYFQILKYFVNPEGRFITADIKVEDKTLTLVNIYAPR